MTTGGMGPTASSALRVSRIIAGALPGGVLAFWCLAWVLTDGGRQGLLAEPALSPRLALGIWAGVALSAFAVALLFRAKALQAGEVSRHAGGAQGSSPSAAQIQTNLIVAWALMEGPALLAGVFFLLIASQLLLSTAAALYTIGVVITFPRAAWFGEG